MMATKKHSLVYTVSKKYESQEDFDILTKKANIVCIGDSLTGWNNHPTHPTIWPFPTYPEFLQEMLNSNNADLCVANAGIAGATSSIGFFTLMNCLEMFTNAKEYIIGFGANDLGGGILTEFDRRIGLTESDVYKQSVEEITEKAIKNLGLMVDSVLNERKKPILINVPNVNEAVFPKEQVPELRAKRDYYNEKVAKYFAGKTPIIDIRSKLKEGHFGDSVHTNKDGAKIIAEAVYEIIKKTEAIPGLS